MGVYCRYSASERRSGRGSLLARIAGIALIAIGTILLLTAVPRWFWTAAVAVLLIGAGCFILRLQG